MSKRNTLLNYFSKSPAVISSSSSSNGVTRSSKSAKPSETESRLEPAVTIQNNPQLETPKQSKNSRKRNVSHSKEVLLGSKDRQYKDDNRNDEDDTPKNVKRRRIVIASDSEESVDEYKPGSDNESSSYEESEPESPNKKKKRPLVTTPSLHMFNKPKSNPSNLELNTPSANRLNNRVTSAAKQKEKMRKKSANGPPDENQRDEGDSKEWFHEKLDWLKDENIRDGRGKSKLDPDYNSKTLYVPVDFKKALTPAMKQWWDLKSEHFDTVLFFKVGKFYELYHMDATIGVKELGLIYMKGDNAHSGFPEISFGKYSDCLVDKGYKVARVEQTETPQVMEQRCKKMGRQTTKFDKVVKREVCQITSKGTKTFTYQGEGMGVCNNFLLAISEKLNNENATEYGICFIDTSIGKFNLGQFKDDRHGSRLLTLFALYPPVEILYDKGSVSKKTLQFLNHNLSGVSKQALGHTEFWNSSEVMRIFKTSKYDSHENWIEQIPHTILDMLDSKDTLLQTPLKSYELAFKSLGGCLWYLQKCGIEDCLLSMQSFEKYVPVDKNENHSTSESYKAFKKHMVLDGITLQNLEIVPLLPSDDSEGTLLETMDFCSTSFGKRLFRNWLCSPLCDLNRISERLDAIEDLANEKHEVIEDVVNQMKKLPDLERFISKIHAFAVNRRTDHPETRAIYYDADIYNKRKITDLLNTVHALDELICIPSLFQGHEKSYKSHLLKDILTFTFDGGLLPDYHSNLKYFTEAFDAKLAGKQGYITPNLGFNSDYDMSVEAIKHTLKELDIFLEKQKKELNCKVTYVGSGKNRYMLEVPENKKVPDGFEFQGGRKGFKRYYPGEVKEMLSVLVAAEEKRDLFLRDFTKEIFRFFAKHCNLWKTAVHCIATLDALISLLLYLKSSGVNMCRPVFMPPNENVEPHLKIIDGCHPTFLKYYTGDDYIPNSVYIGKKQYSTDDSINKGGKVILVTGPNMGGKSTLMRQAGTLVIMAHIGSYVPAESMELTPVDRIFTRVGASDCISKGESTFFVEASETSSILHHATSDSLVLLDELGRGTATFDGTAMASAVLGYLANDISCRTLFSTHYHSLVEDFQNHPHIGLGHMACLVERDSECPALEKITFLYKFAEGACSKSYGFNVASLAGIPKQNVQHGYLKAQELEHTMKILKLLKKLLVMKSPEEIILKLKKYLV